MNVKTWRLLRNWYQEAVGQVKYDGQMSENFSIGRGVNHARIHLIPCLVPPCDGPITRCLETSKVGLTSMQEVLWMQMTSGSLPV